MNEWHLTDVELAQLSDEGNRDEVGHHTDLCPRCQSRVADYKWLQAELAATFRTVVNRDSPPPAAWGVVRKGVRHSRHRQTVRLRASALVSAAMVVCLLLWAPSLIKPVVAADDWHREVPMQPTPMPVIEPTGAHGGLPSPDTSAVWAASFMGPGTQLAPSIVPLPTPPDSQW
ncbi:MAG: hypothetical protein PVG25_07900 [Anaerolineae bacterium]|jgi:hypothetical protein